MTNSAARTATPLAPSCKSRSDRPTRRRVLGALAALPAAFHMQTRAEDTGPIKIAQSTALSGPLGDLGQALHEGAKICFTAVNAKGGVHGRPIELTVADDGYDTKRALANVKGFIADRSNFALFNCLETPMVEAMLPLVNESGIPFLRRFQAPCRYDPKTCQMFSTSAPATRMKRN